MSDILITVIILIIVMKVELNMTVRKYSKKRQAILELLKSTDSHPNAEWIYNKLKPQYPDLSLGTVYRNLSLFKEEGKVICAATVNGQDRFDADTSSHSHFICKSCGAVLDIEGTENLVSRGLISEAEKTSGCIVEEVKLDFYGFCANCGFQPAR